MSHPGEQLIDYVDGALGSDASARIEAHLEGCATCHEEVRLARAGKRAAGSLSAPPVPAGLAEAAIAEAARVAREHNPEVVAISSEHRRLPNAPRWAAIATATAVIVAIALIGPKLGQAPGTVAQEALPAAGAAATAYPRPSAVEIVREDYSVNELSRTAADLRSTALRTAGTPEAQDGAGTPAEPTAGFDAGSATVTSSIARLPRASSCLQRAFAEPEGSLVRIILARYEGEPAYLGVYIVGPGAGLPASELRLDVASVHGCDFLAQSSARI